MKVPLTDAGPFDLRLAVFGHGWIDLEPFAWDEGKGIMQVAFVLDGHPVDVGVRQVPAGLEVTVGVEKALRRPQLAEVKARVLWMLRLDEDFQAFWTRCRGRKNMTWVCDRGAGRLLRAPSLFEDLVKILFTTNCAWGNTRSMTRRLVEALGEEAPSGRRAFPEAERCADEDVGFWAEEVRAGYRAKACYELSRLARDGGLEAFMRSEVPTAELRKRLAQLRGFGPYAVGQALRALGRYDDLALDSAVRAKLPGSDKAIARRYKEFEEWAGLALWMDFTREWHQGEDAPTW